VNPRNCLFGNAGYSPTLSMSSDQNKILRGGWSSGDGSVVQIMSKPLVVSELWGSKFALSH